MTRELLETRRPVIITNARDDPRTVKSTVRYWKIRSIMEVPMILDGEVVGVIFLDDENSPRVFTEREAATAALFANLAAVSVKDAQGQIELRSQLDASQRQLKALRRATAVDERLSEVVLEGRPLQDLLDTLAELLGKPCAVFSAAGERLATALPPGGAADDRAAPARAGVREQTRRERGACRARGRSRLRRRPAARSGVLHRHLVAPVLLGSELWGRLVVMEHKPASSVGTS